MRLLSFVKRLSSPCPKLLSLTETSHKRIHTNHKCGSCLKLSLSIQINFALNLVFSMQDI